MTIQVKQQEPWTFSVTVTDRVTTEHVVTVNPEDYRRFTTEGATVEALVKEAFVFLLAHEPNSSILRNFDLSVISNYFPEFEQVIRARFKDIGAP